MPRFRSFLRLKFFVDLKNHKAFHWIQDYISVNFRYFWFSKELSYNREIKKIYPRRIFKIRQWKSLRHKNLSTSSYEISIRVGIFFSRCSRIDVLGRVKVIITRHGLQVRIPQLWAIFQVFAVENRNSEPYAPKTQLNHADFTYN